MQQVTRNGAQNPNAQQHQTEGIHNNNQNIGGGSLIQNNGQKINVRDNLHYAADSVSHAMTSLVRELNTGALLMSYFTLRPNLDLCLKGN